MAASGHVAAAPVTAATATRKRDKRRRIIEESLTLEDRHDAAGKADAISHCSRRDGIGWRDDRPQREADGQRQLRHDGMQGEADAQCREQHEPDREQEDRAKVAPEVRDRGLEGGDIEQRWDDAGKHQLRIQLDLGEPRNE